MTEYNPKEIENKWQKIWEENKTFKTGELDYKKEKMHVIDMFPYPSGEGLHVGHAKVFTASDIYARYKRMQGYNVLHATGYDSFGLPAEQYAIKNKINPKISTKKNTDNFTRQMKILGLTYDWDREINTTDPEFYKWTQWIFKELYKAGLCYESYEPINWCPSCKTGLANEDLENGLCERCGSVVEKKPIRQWVIKITDYAEKLLSGVDNLDWKENIKETQRNWIGKSEGAEIEFTLISDNVSRKFKVFTTRPDTLFGCTYCVFSPEHPLISDLLNKNLIPNSVEVEKYIIEAKNKTEIERTATGREKTGVQLVGIHAINPANNKPVPVFIADYVLNNYGTGAIMAVPAHDERDFEFAKKYNIEIKEVIRPYVVDWVNNPPKPEFKTTIRNNAHAIVFDKENQKYLILRNKEHNWDTVVIGGMEEGENTEQTARREVYEETGYKNLKFIRILGNPVQAGYFAKHKNENRLAISTCVYFEIENLEKDAVKEDEGNEILWIEEKDFIPKNMVNTEFSIWLQRLKNPNLIFCDEGVLINSEKFDGMSSAEAKIKITEQVGGKIVNKYKIRDWVFARQRYWGEPFPIVFDDQHKSYLVADNELPVMLPEVENYEPTGDGESPLANIKEFTDVWGYINSENEFVSVDPAKLQDDKNREIKLFKRETNTMPQWAGSSWYWLRYMDPHNQNRFVGASEEKYWSNNGYGVDVYFGGMEHAARHLIYARFWNQFLFDKGYISAPEPFKRLEAVGLVLGSGGTKMSKRIGNIVNPDDVVNQWGADTLRLYISFAGDYHDSFSWEDKNIIGPRRFIEKIWNMQYKLGDKKISSENEILLNQTIKKVTEDLESLKYNTAISQVMILVNSIEKENFIDHDTYKIILQLLSPIIPFVTEEIWSNLSNNKSATTSISTCQWPVWDTKKITNKTVNIALQINGKLRDVFTADADLDDSAVTKIAQEGEIYKKWVTDSQVKKIIIIRNKVINIIL